MKKNGFAFIETVITVVVLSAALLMIYSSYNAILSDEEKRLYYDDMAYIYKTNYVRRFLEEYSEIENLKKQMETNYIRNIGNATENFFVDEYAGMSDSLNKLMNNFRINQILLINSKLLDNPSSNSYFENLNYNLKSYIYTLNERDADFYIVVEYSETVDASNGTVNSCIPEFDKYCVSYYSALEI